jgi:hypothetical protein
MVTSDVSGDHFIRPRIIDLIYWIPRIVALSNTKVVGSLKVARLLFLVVTFNSKVHLLWTRIGVLVKTLSIIFGSGLLLMETTLHDIHVASAVHARIRLMIYYGCYITCLVKWHFWRSLVHLSRKLSRLESHGSTSASCNVRNTCLLEWGRNIRAILHQRTRGRHLIGISGFWSLLLC